MESIRIDNSLDVGEAPLQDEMYRAAWTPSSYQLTEEQEEKPRDRSASALIKKVTTQPNRM